MKRISLNFHQQRRIRDFQEGDANPKRRGGGGGGGLLFGQNENWTERWGHMRKYYVDPLLIINNEKKFPKHPLFLICFPPFSQRWVSGRTRQVPRSSAFYSRLSGRQCSSRTWFLRQFPVVTSYSSATLQNVEGKESSWTAVEGLMWCCQLEFALTNG